MTRAIMAGDGLLVGDRCRVRGFDRPGRVEELPTLARRTYVVRLESGELIEREWLQLDRIVRMGGLRPESSNGTPIEWDAHPAPSCGRRVAHTKHGAGG